MQYLISDESLYLGADDFLHIEGDGSTFYHIRNHIERTLRKIDEIVSTVHFMFDPFTLKSQLHQQPDTRPTTDRTKISFI